MATRPADAQPTLPRPRTSSTVMSSTEIPKPGEERHILHPPASSYKPALRPGEHTSGLPQMRIPQKKEQSQPPFDLSYKPYRPGPSVPHPLDFSEQHPTAPLRHIIHQPDLSPTFTPLQESRFEFTAGNKQLRQPEDAPPLAQRRQAKKIGQRREMRDEDYARLDPSPATLSSRLTEQDRSRVSSIPEPTLKVEESQYQESSSRMSSSNPMQISELITENSHNILPEPRFSITLRQQPIAARACGFGERDRRVIDPPPILQMTINDPVATPDEIISKLRYPFSVIHCELWNAETDNEETAMPEMGERRQQRRLMGTLVASPFFGRDEHDVEGCFFCFPDLSCRTSGRYRLRFVLVVLDPAAMKPGDKSPFRATVMSQPFQVYAAKDFPGMEPSTELTKRLKDQGCLISVKKGNVKTTAPHGRDDDGDEEEDEEEEEPAQPSAKARGKRLKK